MSDEILIAGKLIPKAVMERVEKVCEEITKHVPGPWWNQAFVLGEAMVRMGFQPWPAGCSHLIPNEGHCEYCLQHRIMLAEFALKAEHADYFKEAALALHNPGRYGKENLKNLIKLLEEKSHLCEEMQKLTEFTKQTQGEFMLRHGIPQKLTK